MTRTVVLPSTGNWYADTAVGVVIALGLLVLALCAFEVPAWCRRGRKP